MAGDGQKPMAIEYQRPFRAGDRLPDTAPHQEIILTAYARDFTGAVFHAGAWDVWMAPPAQSWEPAAAVQITGALATVSLAPDSWLAFSFTPPGQSEPCRPGSAVLPAVHYPFAAEVLGYSYGSGAPPFDWLNGAPFTDPATALGRPTVDTTGDDWFTAATQWMPVVCVQPPSRAWELVSLGAGGVIELAFDHRVFDHPDNPYGIDFIVFGNSFQSVASGGAWTNGDPNTVTVGASCFVEPAIVAVSQDGIHWHVYTNGPFADGFAPTLGRVFDTNHVDGSLGEWNRWWGGPTDPTLPIDPSLAPSQWAGMSVAEISRRYRGGAGGVGFDLAALPLATDEITGLKWIQFVRIERQGALTPEIDAIADVSPVLPHGRWLLAAFEWMRNPADQSDLADPDLDATPNLLEYAVGRDPLAAEHDSLVDVVSNVELRFRLATNAMDVRVAVERADHVAGPWTTNGLAQAIPVGPPTNGTMEMSTTIPQDQPMLFLRLKVRHE